MKNLNRNNKTPPTRYTRFPPQGGGLRGSKKAFTLVELIIVITILAILATIAFVSFGNYTKSARDANRTTTLKNIEKGLELYTIKSSKYPAPEEYVEISSGNILLIKQGIIGQLVSSEIKLNKETKDPKDNTNYLYSTNGNNTKYQLGTYLEEDNKTLLSFIFPTYGGGLRGSFIPKIYASSIDYTNRYFYTIGNKIGILLKSATNEPLIKTQSFTGVDLSNNNTDSFKAYFSNDAQSGSITSSGTELIEIIKENQKTIQIEQTPPQNPPQTSITCPTGYILVPGNTDFSTSDFCVMKYEAKNVSGVATSHAAGTPWVSITQPSAITTCNALNNGTRPDGIFHLITNNEWMTIARNIEQQDVNWSGGSKGTNYIYSGHNDNSPANALAASTDDNDGYNGTLNSSGSQKRTHTLSNGQVIWDISGNVWEHVNGTNNLTTNTGEVLNGKACSVDGWNSWNSQNDGTDPCSFTDVTPTFYSKANHGPAGDYNANHGVGRIYSSTAPNRIFLRGGSWDFAAYAGVFSLYLHSDASRAIPAFGFRCAFSVN